MPDYLFHFFFEGRVIELLLVFHHSIPKARHHFIIIVLLLLIELIGHIDIVPEIRQHHRRHHIILHLIILLMNGKDLLYGLCLVQGLR